MTDNNQPAKSQATQLQQLPEDQVLKLASAYVPKGQPSKVAYIKLVQEKCMNIGNGKFAGMDDLLAFMYSCYRTGLDPIANQIHTQFRWDGKLGRNRMIVITGIDGFRLIAQRSKKYGGQDDAKFEVETLFNPVTGNDEKQLKATVTVYIINNKNGERMAVTASARWNAYAQKFNVKDQKTGETREDYSGVWKSNPHGMLAKCAEALALRKAFPQELSGIYSEDELTATEDTRKQIINDLPTPQAILDRKAKAQNAPQSNEVVETGVVSKTDGNKQESTKTEEKQPEKVQVVNNPEEASKKLNEILDKKKALESK